MQLVQVKTEEYVQIKISGVSWGESIDNRRIALKKDQ